MGSDATTDIPMEVLNNEPFASTKQPVVGQWSKAETEMLFHKNRSKQFSAEDFHRTERECAEHMADVLCVIFGGSSSSALLGIQHVVKRFYDIHDAEASETGSSSVQTFTPTLTEAILRRCLVERKSWNGFEMTKSECDHHLCDILGSICYDRSCTMEQLFTYAIGQYYLRYAKRT
jgi:hypothetical protein